MTLFKRSSLFLCTSLVFACSESQPSVDVDDPERESLAEMDQNGDEMGQGMGSADPDQPSSSGGSGSGIDPAGGSNQGMGGGSTDPCADVTCGERATCSSSTGTCRCDAGTIDVDGRCVEEFVSLYNLAFLSPVAVSGDMGGLEGADALCNEWARQAGAPGTYRAILSVENETTGDTAANTRLEGARGWVRRDGLPVGDEPAEVFSNQWGPEIAVRLGPDGTDLGSSFVWTGSATNGTPYNGWDCEDWTSSDAGHTGATGMSSHTGGWWIGAVNDDAGSCDDERHFYCFGVDKNTELDLADYAAPQETAATMFVTRQGLPVVEGSLDDMDDVCQVAAKNRPELSGRTFLAFLAVDGVSAVDRFEGNRGAAVVRPDGLLIAEDLEALARGEIVHPPNVTEQVPHHWSSLVPTGASAIDTEGLEESTCVNWESSKGDTTYGFPGSTSDGSDGGHGWFSHVEAGCQYIGSYRLLCFEDLNPQQ